MTRGETNKVLRRNGGRGVIAVVVTAITIASALWLGASWNSGSTESASWNSGTSGTASWVSGADSDGPAATAAGSGAAPE